MKAFFIDRYGKQNGAIGELPEPAVGVHDVLIQVHAASVNPLDAKLRTGEFKRVLPYALPLVLGNDLAGVVMRVGSAVTHFKPGDEVYARPPEARIGTFAERIAVNENALALKPANLSMAEAASLPLAASGVVGYWAIELKQFSWLVASHALLGIYIAFANFNRFAATDGLGSMLKPRAISLVVAGGVIAAVTGPLLIRSLKTSSFGPEFAACYAAFTLLALVSFILNLCIKEVRPAQPAARQETNRGQTLGLVLHNKTLAIAICIAAIGYGIMNLLMIQASMHMSHLHVHFSDISTAIQWHVLAMFAPSFFTGRLIARFGKRRITALGLVMIAASALMALMGLELLHFWGSLVLLGVGWNFGFIGATAMVTECYRPAERAKVQALNDFLVFGTVAVASFGSGQLLHTAGWDGINTWLLPIVGVVLLMLAMQGRGRGAGAPA